MGRLLALLAVASVAAPAIAAAQSPPRVKYCTDLADAYRKARAAGKEAQPGAGQAVAQCQTLPDDGIEVLEKALTAMQVELPPR